MFETDLLTYLNLTINEKQLNQFKQYFNFLIEYNKHTNLTRITEQQEVYYKHFFDSLSICRLIDFQQLESICDMGAGAGFPSIPLKIMFPHLKVSIVDSLNKRIVFLKELVKLLNLENVQAVHDRAQSFAGSNLERFDVVTARALGALDLILPMGMPMVKKEGVMIALKGSKYQEEIDAAQVVMQKLKVNIKQIDEFELPLNYGFRANILLTKTASVSNFSLNKHQKGKH